MTSLRPNPDRLTADQRRRNSTIKQGSQRTGAYKRFAKNLRRKVGHCEMRSRICTGGPDTIHHVIKLSAGGARVPGELADRQGQVFVVACFRCNVNCEDDPKWCRENGFVKRNRLRRMDACTLCADPVTCPHEYLRS